MSSDKLNLKPYLIQAEALSKTAHRELYLAKLPYSQGEVLIRWEAEGWSTPDFQEVFMAEKRHLARFDHPYIPRLLDFGEQHGRFYTVYPYLKGFHTLADRLVGGFLPMAEVLRYTEQIASALDYAHARGMAHRGLEPQRIWLDHYENLYVAHWGRPVLSSSALRYASPAQFRGHFEMPASDIYSLGVLLYHMLTGYLPYAASDEMSLAYLLEFGRPALPYRGEERLSAALERVLERAFNAEYLRAGDLAQDLGLAVDRVTRPSLPPCAPMSLETLWTSAQTGEEGHLDHWEVEAVQGVWLPNEGQFLVGGEAGILYRGAPHNADLTPLATLPNAIQRLALCGFGEHQAIAVLLASGQVSLHKRNGQALLVFGEAEEGRVSLVCTPQGDIFMQGTAQGELVFYNILDVARPRRFQAHECAITTCALNGQLLAVGGEDGVIKLWSWRDERLLQVFEGHTAAITALELKGELVFSGAANGEVRVWDILMQDRPLSLLGHTAAVGSCQMFEGGQGAVYGLSGCLDGTARLWDLRRGVEIERYVHPQGVTCAALAGDHLLLTGKSLHHLDLGQVERLSKHDGAVRDVVLLEKTLVSVGGDSQIIQTNLDTGRKEFSLRRRDATRLLPQTRFVWLGYQDGMIQCWDWARQSARWEGDAHQASITWLLLTEEQILISGGLDGVVESRNALVGARHDAVAVGSAAVRAGVIYQNQLVIGTQEGQIAAWDLGRGERQHLYAELGAPVMRLVAHQDYLLAGVADGRVLIWEGERVWQEFQAHSSVIAALAVHPPYVVTADLGGQVRLWDWQAGCLGGEWNFPQAILALAWAKDGSLILGDEVGNLQRVRFLT